MKNSVKRLLAMLMAGAMAASLTACGGSSDSTSAAGSSAAESSAQDSEAGPVMTRIQENGKLVLGTASGYAPYEFIDISSANQDVIGVDMALGQKIAEKLGVDLEIQDTTFTATLAAVAADQVDIVIAGMSPTDERKETMDFSDVYLKAEQRILVRKEDAEQYKELSDFDGKTIAVQKTTTQEKIAQDLLTNSTINSLEKIPVCVLELTSGKADAVVIESTVAQQYIMANPDLVLCDATFPEERLYKDTAIAVPKGNEDFLEVINEVIKECQDEGLIDQWIEEYSEICVENNKTA